MLSSTTIAALVTFAYLANAEVQTLHEGFTIDAYLDPVVAGGVMFEITMPKSSWVGIGLGAPDMTADTDMIQIDGGNQVVYDRYSIGNG